MSSSRHHHHPQIRGIMGRWEDSRRRRHRQRHRLDNRMIRRAQPVVVVIHRHMLKPFGAITRFRLTIREFSYYMAVLYDVGCLYMIPWT